MVGKTSTERVGRSAVGWLKHLNISPQCSGNGIDWQSGNGVHLSDSVIQGWSQFGFRGGARRGGGIGTEFHNVYMEASASCTNPLGNVGQAAVIEQGKTFLAESPAAGIAVPKGSSVRLVFEPAS